MKYILHTKQQEKNAKLDIPMLKEKIEIVKNNSDESCKYINNVYASYIKVLNNEKNLMKDMSSKFDTGYCTLSEDFSDILKISSEDKLAVFCFTNNISDRYMNLYSYCLKNDINIYFVGKFSKDIGSKYPILPFKYLAIVNALKDKKSSSIFFDFDTSCISDIENWHIITKRNYENILNKFNSFSKEEIQRSPKDIAYCSIINKMKKTNFEYDKSKINLENIIRLLMNIKKFTISNNVKYGTDCNNDSFKVANIYCNDIDVYNAQTILELSTLINTLCIDNKKDRIEYIYDTLCSYLEEEIGEHGYCNFSENKCIAQRDSMNKTGWPKNEYNGCCYDIEGKKDCKHLLDKSCTITCVSCRLFTCRYLKDRGIDYDIRKNLQIKCFISPFKKPELIWNFFTEKEKILQNVISLNSFLKK